MAESRTTTILVTDLVGSTELRVRIGEERADNLRRAHDKLLRTAIEAKGGHVVKGLGDGVLAIFSGAADAISAAVAIQQAAYAHNLRAPDAPLDIRIGLSSGDVSVENDDCFGTPVIEAARLCAVALGGNILAADVVRALARGRGSHVFTAAGDRELKGLPEPVPVVVVGWEPSESGLGIRFPARIGSQSLLPFSGRHDQAETLLQAWKEATTGERRTVLISGEPGIGKTRLAAEVARHVHDRGGIVLYGRCDEDLGLGYQPFVEAVEQIVTSAPDAHMLGRLAGELVRLVPDIGEVYRDLAPPLQSDPDTERYRLFDAVAALFGALSSQGVLLVLDDLHWAEKPTLLLLRHLVRTLEPMRLLVIGTYRDTDLDRAHPLASVIAALRNEPGVSRLALTGLDVGGVVELLSNAAAGRIGLDLDEFAQLLWNETEGNPFFVQEVILSLVESGRVVQRDGVWTTDLALGELGIPEGVRETVGRRLSRLDETCNNVLTFAAIIGPVVEVDLLISASELDEGAVLDALDTATAAGLLRETPSGAYEFTHALVRSTLYDEVSMARRARRHRRIAEALERRRTRDVAALAYHFRRAGSVDERAIDYSAAAGEVALADLAFDQAVAFFTQALQTAEDVESEPPRRAHLLLRLGVSERLAGIASYRETLLRCAELAKALGDVPLLTEAALANSRGLWSNLGEVDAERVAVLESALEAVRPQDSPTRARLLALLAVELIFDDPDSRRRLALADDAIAMGRRLPDDRCLLEVWSASLVSTWVPDRVPRLVGEMPDLCELAERLADSQTLVIVYSFGYMHFAQMGDFEGADRLLDRLAAVVSDAHTPLARWLEAVWRCGRLMLSGSGDDIEAAALRALELGTEADQPDAFGWFAAQLFFARLAQGRPSEIVEVFRGPASDYLRMPSWRSALALALFRSDNHAEAAEVIAEFAADPRHAFPDDQLWVDSHVMFAEVLATTGTPEQAAMEYAVLEPYEARIPYEGALGQPSVHFALALLAGRAGWPAVAERHFEEAERTHKAIGAESFSTRTRFEWGRFLLADGEPGRGRGLLSEALRAAERLGATDIVEKAFSLL